jgi:membrane protease subunit (stomatin/prohibitin family)
MEIQNGASLTVRDSQMAMFVNEGTVADVFSPGMYKLTTQTLPVLTYLKNWDKLFESPFKSDVYFFSTRTQLDQKWGTPNPITIRDKDFGIVRMRAFGIYSYHLTDPKVFYQKISGTREVYTREELEGQLRNTMVAGMTDLFGDSGVAFIDMAGNQDEFGKAMHVQDGADVRRIRPDAGFAGRPERVAAGRAAEDSRPEDRHEHDRRHGALHAVPGRQRHSRKRRRTKAAWPAWGSA